MKSLRKVRQKIPASKGSPEKLASPFGTADVSVLRDLQPIATQADLARWKAELVPMQSGLELMTVTVERMKRRIAAAEYLIGAAQDEAAANGG
jgi:hypothetical protein